MSLRIQRLGWLGVALESTPGVPVTPAYYVPYTNLSLAGKQEALQNQAAYGVRDKNFGSQVGKQWGEGAIEFQADATVMGYFAKAVMGSYSVNSLGNSVYTHTFTRNNTNTPQALSVTVDRGVDRRLFTGTAIDKLELKVSDGFATAKADVKSFFPVTSASGTLATVSGTLFNFAQYSLGFGASVGAALTAAQQNTVKVTDFTIDWDNNVTADFRANSNQPAAISPTTFAVSGEYSLMFENTTDRDRYEQDTKTCMVANFNGAGLAAGNRENMALNIYQARLDGFDMNTGLDTFFMVKTKFTAELDNVSGKSFDMTITNTVTSY